MTEKDLFREIGMINEKYVEEAAQVNEMQLQLGAYVDISLARFVLGEVEINDETIAAFRKGLSEKHMPESAYVGSLSILKI